MSNRKMSFFILLVVFSLLAGASLTANRINVNEPVSEMGLSMGGVMKHHALGLTPSELLHIKYGPHMVVPEGSHQFPPLISSLSFLTTVIVFTFLPLLVGGAVLVFVIWT